MERQTYYWIGFFSACVVVVTVGAGVLGVASEHALSVVAVAVGILIGLTFSLFLVIVLRRWILERVLGRVEATIEEATTLVQSSIASAVKGDIDTSTEKATLAGKSFIGWYVWSNFYRWVIATNIFLLAVFAGLSGTVLLFEQIRRMDEQNLLLGKQTNELVEQRQALNQQNDSIDVQNALLGLSIVDDLRERLRAVLRDSLDATRAKEFYQPILRKDRSCLVDYGGQETRGQPNNSSILAVVELAQSPAIGEQVVQALGYLVRDADESVALGATIALDQLQKIEEPINLTLTNRHITGISMNSPVTLSLTQTTMDEFDCPACVIRARNSILVNVSADRFDELSYSVLSQYSGHNEDIATEQLTKISRVTLSLVRGNYPVSSDTKTWAAFENFFSGSFTVDGQRFHTAEPLLIDDQGYSDSLCEALSWIAGANPYLFFSDAPNAAPSSTADPAPWSAD